MRSNLVAKSISFESVKIIDNLGTCQAIASSCTQESLILAPGIVIDLITIPKGSFQMGARDLMTGADAAEVHTVNIDSFKLGKYPVSQALYRHVMGTNPSFFHGDHLPVENVNWFDAKNFCNKLSTLTGLKFRLASESEWEYSARGGTSSRFYCGNIITSDLGNYMAEVGWENGPTGLWRQSTTALGTFAPNPFGLYDMQGNVFDWCEDIYGSYHNAPSDGKPNLAANGPIERVLRGGSWYHTPIACTTTCRLKINPSYRGPDISFRIALSN